MSKQRIVFLLFFPFYQLFAQDSKEIFYDILEEDQTNVEALALYPLETRNSILQAAMYPEVLLRLEHIQSKVRGEFIELIKDLSRQDQSDFYELTRYDGLMEQLALDKKNQSSEKIKEILKNYPSDIHEIALKFSRRNHNLLVAANNLNTSATASFENVLSPYSDQVKRAYRHLIELPEVLEILAENMRLTVAVGDLYRRQPDWVRTRLDSLNLEAARNNAQASEEWKNKLENDPELLQEFQNSAESYARERGYSEDEIRQERQTVSHVTYHHFYAYPYWFGFPYWYPTSFWHRWPLRYDWGFFYGPGDIVFLTGMPSFYFTYWHFASPLNHYYFPYLSSSFLNHFRQHPRTTTGVSAGVSTWLSDNRENVPRNFLADDGQQVERMREYGQFESEYRERSTGMGGQSVSREAYLQANVNRFQRLAEPGLSETEIRTPQAREGSTRGRMEGEAARSRSRFDDGLQRDSRFEDPASPEIRRTPPQKREGRVSPPEGRQRALDRTPMPAPAPRVQPPAGRQQEPMPAPAPRQAPPATSPSAPPVQRGNPPAGRSPGQSAQPGSPQARPMKIIYESPENAQTFDMARRHHYLIWKK
jgi:hypothetical protein